MSPLPLPESIAGFTFRFVLGYAVVVTLWLVGFERLYDDALAWTGMHVLDALEQPHLTAGVYRDGTRLIAAHTAAANGLPDAAIDGRRVHSNTALFAALTLATPNVTWAARAVWLAGGCPVLGLSHLAHVLATIQSSYAVERVGPYTCESHAGELGRTAWGDLWDLWGKGGPCLRRAVMLRLDSLFGIALQRVIPCALWLPLFLAGIRSRRQRPGTK